jgi:hypothetical protein
MSNRDRIQPILERVVGEVLDDHAALLRSEIVRRLMEEVSRQPADPETPSAHAATDLARGISEIQAGNSQREILRALLDSSANFAARVALFVVKGGHATGWQARGFQGNDALKDFSLDSESPAVVKALAGRVAASVSAADFDTHFMAKFGTPAGGEARLLPLILKDKVAALVYADAGSAGTLLDVDSLAVLVLATGAWLEVNALRKQTPKETSSAHAETAHSEAPSAVAPASAPAFNDPFSAHSPVYAMASAAGGDSHSTVAISSSGAAVVASSMENVAPAVTGESQSAAVIVQSASAAAMAPVSGPIPMGWTQTDGQSHGFGEIAHEAASSVPSGSPADDEIHQKARRFARLLVEEIKLYNQDRVLEGRKNNDLYERLKDVIEKSRSTYQKRYGNSVAASGNYFEDEVKRSLVEDDPRGTSSNLRM